MALGDQTWEMGEDGNTLVTEEMWLGNELHSIQLGAWGRDRLGVQAQQPAGIAARPMCRWRNGAAWQESPQGWGVQYSHSSRMQT